MVVATESRRVYWSNFFHSDTRLLPFYHYFLFQTFLADSIGDNISAVNFTPGSEPRRKLGIIHQRPVKVDDFKAVSADQVMMALKYHLKAGLAFPRFHLVNQTMPDERGQRPIDSVQRERRNPSGQTLMQRLRRRMIDGSGQLAIDLQALMGQLEAGPPAGRLEMTELFPKPFPIHPGRPN